MKEEEGTMEVTEQKTEVNSPYLPLNWETKDFIFQVSLDQPGCSKTSTLIDLTDPTSSASGSSDCDSQEDLPEVSLVHGDDQATPATVVHILCCFSIIYRTSILIFRRIIQVGGNCTESKMKHLLSHYVLIRKK